MSCGATRPYYEFDRLWHKASIYTHALNGRYWSNSGHWSARVLNASVANDPTATLAVRCGISFGNGLGPYQSAPLSRKDGSSRAKGPACNGAIFSVFWVARLRGH